MHLPEIDKYAHLKSIFHSWEPRLKLISFSILIISFSLLSDLLSASLGFVFALIFVFLSRIPFYFVLKNMKWVLFFVLFFFIIMPLTVPGKVLFRLNFITVSREGVRLAFLIALKAISICMLIFPMIGTMRFDVTLKALSRLKVPDKLSQIIMFTYRYIFVFIEESRRMFIAAKARLFKEKRDFFTLRVIANLIAMLFIRGFERTQKVYNAMVSRGYNGKVEILDEFVPSGRDFLKASVVISLAIFLIIFRFL